MTQKQKKFVEVYLQTGNATEAAAQVYNCKKRKTAGVVGMENLAKPYIAAEISKRQAEVMEIVQKRTEITAEYLLRGLQEVAERCMQRAPVMEFSREQKAYVQAEDGEGRALWTFNANGANRAFELLGKTMPGFFAADESKVEVSGKLVKLDV